MPQGKPWEYDAPFQPQLNEAQMATNLQMVDPRMAGAAQVNMERAANVGGTLLGAVPIPGLALAGRAGKVLQFLSKFKRGAAAGSEATKATQATKIIEDLRRWKEVNKFSDGQIISALREQHGVASSVAKQMLKALKEGF